MELIAKDTTTYEIGDYGTLNTPIFRAFEITMQDATGVIATAECTLIDVCGLRDETPSSEEIRERMLRREYLWVFEALDYGRHAENYKEHGFVFEYEPFVVIDQIHANNEVFQEAIDTLGERMADVCETVYSSGAAMALIKGGKGSAEKIRILRSR